MNTTTSIAGTAAIVVAGRWAQEKPVDLRIAIGAAGFAIGVSLLSNQAPDIAKGITLLALLTASFMYVPDIAKKTGITEARPKEK